VTVHDVIPLLFPEHYPPGVRGKLNFQAQKLSLKTAKAIITDSEASQKDIVNYLSVDEKKVFPIYLAAAKKFRPVGEVGTLKRVIANYQLPKKYVLYVGDVNYHKNVLALVEACKKINVPLVIVGKQAAVKDFDQSHIENQPLVRLIKDYGGDPSVLRLGFVPDQDLAAVYSLATVYCQPSLAEGFGLPVLEAMACGAPVVATKAGSLPEIVGQSAVLVNPNSLTDGLKKVLSSAGLRGKLKTRGFAQVQKFSWEQTARQTLDVYQTVCQKDSDG